MRQPARSTAAIAAGGRAVRLGGRDKGALPIGGDPITARQIAVLQEVATELLIVANVPERYARFGVRVVPDVVPGAGPLGGIYTAICAAATDRTLVVACDMPFLRADLLAYLIDAADGYDAAVPRTADGYQPLCAVYSKACAAPIRERINRGELKVVGLLADVRVREIGPEELAGFDPGRAFVNVNTPDDYDCALKSVP